MSTSAQSPSPSLSLNVFVPRSISAYEAAADRWHDRFFAPMQNLAGKSLGFADRLVASWMGSFQQGTSASPTNVNGRALSAPQSMGVVQPWYDQPAAVRVAAGRPRPVASSSSIGNFAPSMSMSPLLRVFEETLTLTAPEAFSAAIAEASDGGAVAAPVDRRVRDFFPEVLRPAPVAAAPLSVGTTARPNVAGAAASIYSDAFAATPAESFAAMPSVTAAPFAAASPTMTFSPAPTAKALYHLAWADAQLARAAAPPASTAMRAERPEYVSPFVPAAQPGVASPARSTISPSLAATVAAMPNAPTSAFAPTFAASEASAYHEPRLIVQGGMIYVQPAVNAPAPVAATARAMGAPPAFTSALAPTFAAPATLPAASAPVAAPFVPTLQQRAESFAAATATAWLGETFSVALPSVVAPSLRSPAGDIGLPLVATAPAATTMQQRIGDFVATRLSTQVLSDLGSAPSVASLLEGRRSAPAAAWLLPEAASATSFAAIAQGSTPSWTADGRSVAVPTMTTLAGAPFAPQRDAAQPLIASSRAAAPTVVSPASVAADVIAAAEYSALFGDVTVPAGMATGFSAETPRFRPGRLAVAAELEHARLFEQAMVAWGAPATSSAPTALVAREQAALSFVQLANPATPTPSPSPSPSPSPTTRGASTSVLTQTMTLTSPPSAAVAAAPSAFAPSASLGTLDWIVQGAPSPATMARYASMPVIAAAAPPSASASAATPATAVAASQYFAAQANALVATQGIAATLDFVASLSSVEMARALEPVPANRAAFAPTALSSTDFAMAATSAVASSADDESTVRYVAPTARPMVAMPSLSAAPFAAGVQAPSLREAQVPGAAAVQSEALAAAVAMRSGGLASEFVDPVVLRLISVEMATRNAAFERAMPMLASVAPTESASAMPAARASVMPATSFVNLPMLSAAAATNAGFDPRMHALSRSTSTSVENRPWTASALQAWPQATSAAMLSDSSEAPVARTEPAAVSSRLAELDWTLLSLFPSVETARQVGFQAAAGTIASTSAAPALRSATSAFAPPALDLPTVATPAAPSLMPAPTATIMPAAAYEMVRLPNGGAPRGGFVWPSLAVTSTQTALSNPDAFLDTPVQGQLATVQQREMSSPTPLWEMLRSTATASSVAETVAARQTTRGNVEMPPVMSATTSVPLMASRYPSVSANGESPVAATTSASSSSEMARVLELLRSAPVASNDAESALESGGDLPSRMRYQREMTNVSAAPSTEAAARMMQAVRSTTPSSASDDRLTLGDLTLIAAATATQEFAASGEGGGAAASGGGGGGGGDGGGGGGGGGGEGGGAGDPAQVEELAIKVYEAYLRLIEIQRERSGESWES